MIADRRFDRAPFDPRFAAAVALVATLIMVSACAMLYLALRSVEVEPPFFHCDKLLDQAANAPPAEQVRLLQEHHEAYCD